MKPSRRTKQLGQSAVIGSSDAAPRHPGEYIRHEVMEPKRLNVTQAAKLIGVGRPALSTLLNGRASVTPEMAARLEVTFGIAAQALLDMQAAFDAASEKSKGAPIDAAPYSVPFLEIKARDIERWATRNISARSRLSILLRTLVNSTGRGVLKIDFPGNDDAERPGWDGEVSAEQGTPWIPKGLSGWEFGTNEDPKTKADDDFSKSVKAAPKKSERLDKTFVFVTPRHWPGKAAWIKAKEKVAAWKSIRAYDSSDIEQWIEQSIAAQSWFAHETGRPSKGVRTLEQCWRDWADVTVPVLAPELFDSYIHDGTKNTIITRLSDTSARPLVIAADSTEEALAFLAQFFRTVADRKIQEIRDRVLVFDEEGVAKQLAQGTSPFVAVAHTREVERELAPMRLTRSILVCPRNAVNVEPDIILEPVNAEVFEKALRGMGIPAARASELNYGSGRSLTILRRHLAISPAVKTPEWANDTGIASQLVPFMWVGAWNATKPADQKLLALMAGEVSYSSIDKRCRDLAALDSPPLWSVAHYRGVVSKIDILFLVHHAVTFTDLERFFSVAELVLQEDDPKLDLPDDKQWAAAIYGKSREFSQTLRAGISETLVLLAIHGGRLFQASLGFNCEEAANKLVRTLLEPLKTRLLEANDNDLMAYAEAAPDAFLSIIEADLKTSQPETYGLLRPVAPGAFMSGCRRTGLLWALECLAWNAETMPRVAEILAQLSKIEINDNWVNKPFHSLQAIFSSWMPQTAASQQARTRILSRLTRTYPDVIWRLLISEIGPEFRTGDYSQKPKWRNDGQGYGDPIDNASMINMTAGEMAEVVLNWHTPYSAEKLCDLVSCLSQLSDNFRNRVWEIIEAWASTASDAERAILKEHIRRSVLSRRGRLSRVASDVVSLTAQAKKTCRVLEPADLLQRHEWLFRQQWVEESADELATDDFDIEARDRRINALRLDALREIYEAHGLEGVLHLSTMGNAEYQIGRLLAMQLIKRREVSQAICSVMRAKEAISDEARKILISGMLHAFDDGASRCLVLDEIKMMLTEGEYVIVLQCLNFRRSVWLRVDGLSLQAQQNYWREAVAEWIRDDDEEMVEGVERLLAAKRPRAAFASIKFLLDKIDAEVVYRTLTDLAKGGEEKEGHYPLDTHRIDDAFECISSSTTLSLEQKAGLEFAYINLLGKRRVHGTRHGIPNLEEYIDNHPDLYLQGLAWSYRRDDDGEDSGDFKPPQGREKDFAERGLTLLESIERIPGSDEDGSVSIERLREWVTAVREGAKTLARMKIADIKLGQLLAQAPADPDGVWPCAPIREIFEEVHSTEMLRGMHTGRYNLRAAGWRAKGGGEERSIAGQYRAWADAVKESHPFVAEMHFSLVQTYEAQAEREDSNASIRRRLE